MAFNPTKSKVQLKLALNRLKLLQQKKTAQNQAARKEIADLLAKGKIESARIKVENIIREDLTIEALELMELYTETLLARFGLLESMRHCDPAISESVNTIIYGSPRLDIPELLQVRDHLLIKFGRDFGMAAMENQNDVVNPRMIQKLKVQTPDPILVNQYLKEIASAYKVEWTSTEPDQPIPSQPVVAPAYSVDVKVPFASSSSQESAPQESDTQFPTIPGSSSSGQSAAPFTHPDFDDLEKRFEALKKKK